MLTPAQFKERLAAWRTRLTLDAIGRELGVTRQAVYEWAKPEGVASLTVLLLAERLMKDKRTKLYEPKGRKADRVGTTGDSENQPATLPEVPTCAPGLPLECSANGRGSSGVGTVVRPLRSHPANPVSRRRAAAAITPRRATINQSGNPNWDYAAEWRAWRQERGWTALQMAQALGVGVNTVYAVESGIKRPQSTTREKMKALRKRYSEASA